MTEEEKAAARAWNAAVYYYESGDYEPRRAVEDMNRRAEERAEEEARRDTHAPRD